MQFVILLILALIQLNQATNICSVDGDISDITVCNTTLSSTQAIPTLVVGSNSYNTLSFETIEVREDSPIGVPYCNRFGAYHSDCTENAANQTGGYTFNGDINYCAGRNCTAGASNCYCRLVTVMEIPYILDDNTPANTLAGQPANLSSANMGYALETFEEFKPPRGHSYSFSASTGPSRKRQVGNTSVVILHPVQDNAQIMLVGQVLYIEYTTSVFREVLIVKGQYQALYSMSNISTIALTLPYSLWNISGHLNIYVYNENLVSQQKSIPIVAETICRNHDCTFCWDAIDNWHCLFNSQKIGLIVLLVLSILALIAICSPCLMWPIAIVVFLIKLPFYYVPAALKSMWTSDMAKDARIKATNAAKYAGFDKKRKPPPPMRANRRLTGANIVILIPFLFAVSLTDASSTPCATTSVVSMIENTCTLGPNNFQDCTAHVSTTINFQNSGTVTCIHLADPSNNEVEFIMEIEYVSTKDVLSLDNVYYSSKWAPVTQYHYRCPKAQHCKNNDCEDLDPLNDRTAYGELTSVFATLYPGEAACSKQQPTFLQCGLAESRGCMYSGYGIVPRSPFYEASSVSTREQIHYFIVTIRDKTGAIVSSPQEFQLIGTTLTEITAPSEQFSHNDIDLEFNFAAPYQTNLPLLSTEKYIIQGDGSAWYGFASAPGDPRKTVFGDIQAASIQALNIASPNAFIYDDDVLISLQTSSTVAAYVFHLPGTSRLEDSMIELPMKISGVTYDISGGNLEGKLLGGDPITLQITSSPDFSYSQAVSLVCPSLSLVSATGCYACTAGSVIVVTALSTCLSGAASVSITGPQGLNIIVDTESIPLTLTNTSFMISIQTPYEDNDFTLVLTSGLQVSSVPVIFKAVEDIILPDTNNDTVVNGTNAPGNGTDTSFWESFKDFFTDSIPEWFDDIFDGVAKWFDYLIFIALSIALLIGAYVGFNILMKASKIRYQNYKIKRGSSDKLS